jgi:hypothetical protein
LSAARTRSAIRRSTSPSTTRINSGNRSLRSSYEDDVNTEAAAQSGQVSMSSSLISENAVPDDEIRYASDPEVEARTVYLVTREAMIGVIVKRTTEQDVTRADGAIFKRDLPTYERVGLPLSENTSLT